MASSEDKRTEAKEIAGMRAIKILEEAVGFLSARTSLTEWEIKNLMRSLAYQEAIEIIPSEGVAYAIQGILTLMSELVDKNGLSVMEVRDLLCVIC